MNKKVTVRREGRRVYTLMNGQVVSRRVVSNTNVRRKEMANATETMTVEQAKATFGLNDAQLVSMGKYGIDLTFLQRLWSVIVQYGPTAFALIKAIIDALKTPPAPVPGPVFSTGDVAHCNHKELCKQSLDAAICAACCAAKHYAICCEEEVA